MSKVAIILVAQEMMHTDTAMCLQALCMHELRRGMEVKAHWQQGTILARARQDVAKAAIEDGAEWLFWVDSDMTFPYDILEHMMAHEKPIVAANCSKRKRPIGPTARRKAHLISGENEPVFPDKEVTGLEQVETVGFGVMLTHESVFKRLAWPWFSQPWINAANEHVGEDVFFCGRCAEAGVPIYIDHEASWGVGHIGMYTFGMKDVLAERELVETGQWGDEPWR